MKLGSAAGSLLAIGIGLLPAAAMAQSLVLSGSPLPDQPYTLIYPDIMVESGEPGGPVTINHPGAPLQCMLSVVPVDDTGWTAEAALANLDEAAVVRSWSATFPGFVLGNRTITAYQSGPALFYEGASTGAEGSAAISLVHTETVSGENGYTLDCYYATEFAEQARPLVDFIIANFSTEQDAQPIAP